MRTPKAKPARALSHWIDETLPRLDSRLLQELGRGNVDDAWLGRALGEYRSARHVQANMPTRIAEADALRAAVAQLDAANLALGDLPPRGRAALLTIASRHEIPWHEIKARLQQDLTLSRSLINRAEIEVRRSPTQRGRKAQGARDYLLHKVIERLRSSGMKATAARVMALKALRACGVPVPSPDQKAPEKKAARAAKRATR